MNLLMRASLTTAANAAANMRFRNSTTLGPEGAVNAAMAYAEQVLVEAGGNVVEFRHELEMIRAELRREGPGPSPRSGIIGGCGTC